MGVNEEVGDYDTIVNKQIKQKPQNHQRKSHKSCQRGIDGTTEYGFDEPKLYDPGPVSCAESRRACGWEVGYCCGAAAGGLDDDCL